CGAMRTTSPTAAVGRLMSPMLESSGPALSPGICIASSPCTLHACFVTAASLYCELRPKVRRCPRQCELCYLSSVLLQTCQIRSGFRLHACASIVGYAYRKAHSGLLFALPFI